ncbi:MAG: gluconate 2-dehydrogenase subunit 3 family protein [Herpetosiphonaceae bacterium]|nr:gluconate 2-dehydrogenase subunit 3 family protein [Herpetosiphonaceae bacterium]
METQQPALISLNPFEARTAAAIFARLFPGGEDGPGATELGVLTYVDHALAGAYRDKAETYRLGLATFDQVAHRRYGRPFADCNATQQDELLAGLEQGTLPDFHVPSQHDFFTMLRFHLQEGLFADPAYGGNRDKGGWRLLGHTGIWFENSAEENLATEPVTKGGEIRSLADVGYALDGGPREPVELPGYDPQRGDEPPAGPADVVLIGVGAAGAMAASILSRAGLRVVGLEAGPWRTKRDFVPDELGSAYYCRGGMGPKFLSEVPRWRRNADEPAREATFTLGRMMNGVGGSVIHWGGALRRCHPHHFKYLTHVRERWGEQVLPEGHTLVDWPMSYDDLEPYYTKVEYHIGVAGDGARNPFVPRSAPLPMPPLRPFTMAELFRQGSEALGLHPYPTPVAVNSVPYNGFPATTYCAWSGGFGPFNDERWHPGLTWVPEALTTGNFDLRTHCRVVRILTDGDGHASGVEYVDANGNWQVQLARTVIVCSYTFENVRLLLISGDTQHPDGLGNNTGQVGKHLMTKMWSDVSGFFPDTVFNAHTGPAAQMWSLDDFISAEFDSVAHGFVGGATPNIENQRLPIQISREALPPDVPRWGQAYKDFIRQWQHIAAVRLQPDTLSYHANYLDLDPRHRDRSGLGLPVLRITYDMQPNEHRMADFMETKAEDILRAMGATKTWRGPRFSGVVSSHELGGCRMGEDPATSVVGPDLGMHDTPGLYVFGTAVFPTCHGVNPTLTMWALCYRAAEQLVEHLNRR